MRPLHLAVDARVVATDVRGIGRYERAILRRLLPRDDVALTLLIPELLPALRKNALAAALGGTGFRVASRVPRDAQVTWFPANGTFFDSRAPVVATIHDAVPFRFPSSNERVRRHDQAPFERSARTARAFVAVSEFGKREICERFRIEPARVNVIYHGVEEHFSPGDPGALPASLQIGGYFLFVGDPSEPRKNFSLLYQAHRAAWPAGDGPALVIAGAARAPAPEVVTLQHPSSDVRGGGDETLLALYRGALGVTVPSMHETFGMPVIEAMACGAPVVAAAGSSLSEIAGDAALLAPPNDVLAWRDALLAISRDASLRASLHERGLQRAKAFSWDASAQAHLALLQSVQ